MVAFIEGWLRHSKAPFAGQPFVLTEWQKRDIIRPLFGTLNADGTRQYRMALIEMPRKNGKTQLAAALSLFLLVGDGEMGAEVYAAAADKEQARRVFDEAKRMVVASPELSEMLEPYRDVIFHRPTQSVYRVLSADAPTKHGLNPSGIVIDELHAHKNRGLWDALTSAQGTRVQPLVVAITTAGADRQSVCYEQHEYARKVRTGQVTDRAYLSVYYGAPEEADWTSRRVWKRANPALSGKGAFLRMENLQEEFRRAEQIPAEQNRFRMLHLNQWVQQSTRWIDLALWDANAGHPVTPVDFVGRQTWGGLDLAAVSDLTAWLQIAACPTDPAVVDVLARFWVPEDQLDRGKNKALYREWVDQGYLEITPGASVDYAFIERVILADAGAMDMQRINVDRLFQGQQLATALQDQGLPIVAMPQTFSAFAAPMVEFERRLTSRQFHHGGHPILRWMADNVVVRRDPEGNLKIDRQKSQEKVDGMVALVMAVEAHMRQETAESAYADGELEIV